MVQVLVVFVDEEVTLEHLMAKGHHGGIVCITHDETGLIFNLEVSKGMMTSPLKFRGSTLCFEGHNMSRRCCGIAVQYSADTSEPLTAAHMSSNR